MTIPENYIGHKDFLEQDIIKEFYPMDSVENCKLWVNNDIINNYGTDYIVHIVRIDDENNKLLKDVCVDNGIDFKNHSSDERIDDDGLNSLFASVLSKHIVIAVKGFYRRANYIPNEWKIKIGATHEKYTKKYDTNVQVQGLPGRMTGYWKNIIVGGHKTGPYRTSIDSMKEYELFYNNPTDLTIAYSTKKVCSFVSKSHIKNFTDNQKTCIPIMVPCTKNVMDIKKKGEMIMYIKDLIENQDDKASLFEFITDKSSKLLKVFKPKNLKQNGIYNRDIIHAYNKNIPYQIENKDSYDEGQKKYQMYIDIIDYKAYFILFV